MTNVPSSAGASPTVSGTVAYDSTPSDLEYGDNGTNRKVANLDEAQTFTNKTLTTPTISATGFTNANHAHTGATSGGQLTDAALSAAVGLAKGGTNQTSWTASRCVQVSAGGTELESAAAACGSGGGTPGGSETQRDRKSVE